jgi:gas vesicle protein
MVGKFLSGLCVGLGIGGAVALMLAPKSGYETRRLIRRKVRKTVNGASARTNAIVHRVRDIASEAVNS